MDTFSITPPALAMLLPAEGALPWHAALASQLIARYGATVQMITHLKDSMPDQMFDLLLDLTGGRAGVYAPVRAKRRLRTLEGPEGTQLLPQLLTGRLPWLAVVDVTDPNAPPQVLADSCPALPQRQSLHAMRLTCAARLTQLVLRALDHVLLDEPLPLRNSPPRYSKTPVPLAKARFAVATVAAKARNAALKPFAHRGQWRLAVRLGGEGRFHAWPTEPERYLADPFLFSSGGVTYLFAEEYRHDTGLGQIVWSRFDPAARAWAVPRVALTRPWHMSYPQVLTGPDNAVYMLPEQSTTGRLTLYRATRFPDRWVPDVDLLTGDDIADATLHQDNSGWWLFCGRGWDELYLYHAPTLTGPYRPHPCNPIKSDARSARPAGRLYQSSDGALIRPAQDCSTGYGVGVALCLVETLDPAQYRETVVARLTPAALVPWASGVHTYDRILDASGRKIEVIDGKTTIARRHADWSAVLDRFNRRRQQQLQIPG